MGVWRRNLSEVLSGLLCAAALFPTIAWAQQSPPAPAATQPPTAPSRGQIEQQVPREERRRGRASVDSRSAIVQTPCALENSPVRVQLNSIKFERADRSALPAELQSLLAPLQSPPAGEQSIAVVCSLRDRANQLLNDAGYVALAQIPAQEIANGELRITIVTARIVEVRILGDAGVFQDDIERRMQAIRQLDPLNRRQAEHILLMAGDIPGLDVRLSLRSAGTQPGDVIGELTVDTNRTQLLANIQNYGSKQLGPVIGSLRGEIYGLTGLADRTFLAYSNSTDIDEIRVVQGGHDFGLNDSGLRLGLRGSLAFSRPDILNLDLRSRSSIIGVDLSQTLARNLNWQATIATGFEALEQRTRIRQGSNDIPFSRDRLRVAYARADARYNLPVGKGDELSWVSGDVEVRKGLNILDASKEGLASGGYSPSRFQGNPQAWLMRGEVVADLGLLPGVSLGAQAFGQWADDPLLNLEEFSLGNYTYGRGYDPGANGGDRALAFRLEPRVSLPLPENGLKLGVQALAFYDFVKLYNLDTGSTEKNRRLRSVGGGLRFLSTQRFILDLLYAHPLDRVLATEVSKPKGRVLASFTLQIHPWGVR